MTEASLQALTHPRDPADLRWYLLPLLAIGLLALAPHPHAHAQPAGELQASEANVGRGGGLVRLPDGTSAALLPGSAAQDPGWHRLHLETAAARMPRAEAVGTRPIDRRASGPLGQVEGPPVALGPGLKLRFVDPDPAEEIAAGMIDADDWPGWLASVPEDLMTWLPPEQAAARPGFLIAVPNAAPEGSKERLSTWLYSPGGMKRREGPGRADEAMEAWDPCLRLGRMDAAGTAWFYLSEIGCGLEEDPVWTPLREQSQQEFSDWVLQESPEAQHRGLKRELKQMARDESKAEREG